MLVITGHAGASDQSPGRAQPERLPRICELLGRPASEHVFSRFTCWLFSSGRKTWSREWNLMQGYYGDPFLHSLLSPHSGSQVCVACAHCTAPAIQESTCKTYWPHSSVPDPLLDHLTRTCHCISKAAHAKLQVVWTECKHYVADIPEPFKSSAPNVIGRPLTTCLLASQVSCATEPAGGPAVLQFQR